MSESSIRLELRNVTVGYGKKDILRGQSILFDKPEIVSVIGPNGSGKSTLLKTMARLIAPKRGEVLLNGAPFKRLSPKSVARHIALLPQTTAAQGDMTVERLVRMGRNPYKSFFRELTEHDRAVAEGAMASTDVLKYRTLPVASLSGGERQRVWLALTLAQEPELLLLDEPTTYLDSRHQLALMELVRRTHAERNMTVVMVLHDLNLALRYSHRIVAIADGAIAGDGTPEALMTEDNIRSWFGVKAEILWRTHGDERYPVCVPYEVLA